MVQLRPRMAQVKADYEKVARQRAALLKTIWKARRRGGPVDETMLDIFDSQLAALGARIIGQRARIVSALRPYVEAYYREVSGGKGVARIDYAANIDARSGWDFPAITDISADSSGALAAEIAQHERELQDESATAARLQATLREWREQEIERGVNLVGPHRDDFVTFWARFPRKATRRTANRGHTRCRYAWRHGACCVTTIRGIGPTTANLS